MGMFPPLKLPVFSPRRDIAMLVMTCLLLASYARAQEDPKNIEERFKAEAPKAWKALEAADEKRGPIKFTKRVVRRVGGKIQDTEETTAVVDRRAGHYLIRSNRKNAEIVYGGNPAYSFTIGKMPGKDGWVLVANPARKRPGIEGDPVDLLNYLKPNGSRIICGCGTLLGIMGDESISIRRAELTASKQVRVAFDVVVKGPKSASKWTEWVEFDPENAWAMRSFEMAMSKGEIIRVVKNFAAAGEGYRPCVGWEMKESDAQEGGERTETTTFEAIEGPTIRDGDCYLSAFDLPEPFGLSPPRSWWYLWFIALAVISLGVGWFFWRRIQARSGTPMSGSAPANTGK